VPMLMGLIIEQVFDRFKTPGTAYVVEDSPEGCSRQPS
jgi:hypothetical protein